MTIQQRHDQMIANACTAIRREIGRLGFRRDGKFVHRECYDLKTLRVAFLPDDERIDVYAFDGVPGSSCLKYEITLPLCAPATVVVAAIKAVANAEAR